MPFTNNNRNFVPDEARSMPKSFKLPAKSKKRKHEEQLHVIVRRVGKSENESLDLWMSKEASVLDLKEAIAARLHEQCGHEDDDNMIPVERQRLIFSGRMLRDNSQLLVDDLKMSTDVDQKHFVHLTPLPKGDVPSARMNRELESSQPLHEQTLQGVRPLGARQQRRRLQEEESPVEDQQQQAERRRRLMNDAVTLHPSVLDLAAGLTAAAGEPAAAAPAVAAGPANHSLATSAVAELRRRVASAAATEQSRLVEERLTRAILSSLMEVPDATLRAAISVAQQREQSEREHREQETRRQLLDMALRITAGISHADIAAILDASGVAPATGIPTSNVTLLDFVLQGHRPSEAASPSVAVGATLPLLTTATATAPSTSTLSHGSTIDAASVLVSALQMYANRDPNAAQDNESWARFFDQISSDAARMASVMRRSINPSPVTDLLGNRVPTSGNGMTLEEQIAIRLLASPGSSTFATGGTPFPFF